MTLERLFKLRRVAVVGASPNPAKLGSYVLASLREGGFERDDDDKFLEEKLLAELPGILAWAVRGLPSVATARARANGGGGGRHRRLPQGQRPARAVRMGSPLLSCPKPVS